MDNINTAKNEPSQRFTAYRAVIPFYILYDLDLNSNHLRLYGQIEQMESNPNPNVNPTFSYQWFADQLGIDRSNAIRTANVMKKKGYIEHVEIAKGKWIWRTVKKPLLHDVNDLASGAECDPPSRIQCDPPSGAECDPKIPEVKDLKNKEYNITDNNFFGDYKTQENQQLTEKCEENKRDKIKRLAIANERCIEAFNHLWKGIGIEIEEAYDACQSYWETKDQLANWGMFIKFLKNPKSLELFEIIKEKREDEKYSKPKIINPFAQHMKTIEDYRHASSLPNDRMLLAIFKNESGILEAKNLYIKFCHWKREQSL